MSDFKIALLQLFSNGLDQMSNLRKGDYYIRLAKSMKADFVLFPELWNIGYTPLDEHGWESQYNPKDPKQQGLLEDWRKFAITNHSSFINHFKALAQELEIGIGITYLEAHQEGPKNTLLVIDSTGKEVFKYHKIHTKKQNLEKFCTPGDTFYVGNLPTKIGPIQIGAMIGGDLELPEAARILMLKGAEIVLIPYSGNLNLKQLVFTRAYENRMGMAVCNYAGMPEGVSMGYNGIAFDPSSQALDMEVILASEAEGIYIATYNLEELRAFRAQEDWGKQLRTPHLYKDLTKH